MRRFARILGGLLDDFSHSCGLFPWQLLGRYDKVIVSSWRSCYHLEEDFVKPTFAGAAFDVDSESGC